MATPWQIQAMMQQLGGMFRLVGEFGARDLFYKDECHDERSPKETVVTPEGCIDYELGIQFRVTARSAHWKMIITLEQSDLYNIYLWEMTPMAKLIKDPQAHAGKVIASCFGIYGEELLSIAKATYVEELTKRGWE